VTTVICGRWNLKETRRCTLHAQHGKSLQRVQSWSHQQWRSSWMWQMLGQKVRSTRHNAVRHDGQLVTPFYGVTSWPCDELTGSSTVTNCRIIQDSKLENETTEVETSDVIKLLLCANNSSSRLFQISMTCWKNAFSHLTERVAWIICMNAHVKPWFHVKIHYFLRLHGTTSEMKYYFSR